VREALHAPTYRWKAVRDDAVDLVEVGEGCWLEPVDHALVLAAVVAVVVVVVVVVAAAVVEVVMVVLLLVLLLLLLLLLAAVVRGGGGAARPHHTTCILEGYTYTHTTPQHKTITQLDRPTTARAPAPTSMLSVSFTQHGYRSWSDIRLPGRAPAGFLNLHKYQ
jgi:hypothetical protein